MATYEDTIEKVKKLLVNNQEWKNRYAGYIDDIILSYKSEIIKIARKKFNVPSQFTLHMSVSKATDVTKNIVKFDLRYHGHNVACLKVNVNKETVEIEAVKNNDIISAINKDAIFDEDKLEGKSNWNEASELRTIYAKLEESIQNSKAQLTKNKEHELESELLKNFSKKSSDGKIICNIKPVTMLKESLFFQMPTPLKASNAKSGIIEYSAEKGGGIDILARIGSGRNTHLAIIELKDKYEKNEPPEKAICQAIAYATFIRELLRSKESGEKWWSFFGFGGDVPKSLKLFAIIAMPNSKNANKNFVYNHDYDGINLSLDGKDQLELGYIYLENADLPQEISKNLPLKSNS
jgi:hypothetical protein